MCYSGPSPFLSSKSLDYAHAENLEREDGGLESPATFRLIFSLEFWLGLEL
jgi:acyl carrier protein